MSAMPHESHTEPARVDYLAELERLATGPGFPVEAVLAPLRMTGTCPVCGKTVVVVNYGVERHGEVGYLGRHGRPGVRVGAKCRGSFGEWVERKRGSRDEPYRKGVTE